MSHVTTDPEPIECPSCYELCSEQPVSPWSVHVIPKGCTLKLPCNHLIHEHCMRQAYVGYQKTKLPGTHESQRQCPLCRNPFNFLPLTSGVPYLEGYNRKPPPHYASDYPVRTISPEDWTNGTIVAGTLLKVCSRSPTFHFGKFKELRGKTQVRLVNDDEYDPREANFGRRGVQLVVVDPTTE